MNTSIVSAIQNRRELSLSYKGVSRVVQPHAYGVSTAGHEVLRCYQVQGSHTSDKPHDWDLMLVSGISAMRETGGTWQGEAPEYRRGDKAMTTIYAELQHIHSRIHLLDMRVRYAQHNLTNDNLSLSYSDT